MAEVFMAFSPGWVHKKDKIVFSEPFSKIISFYLFGTPCDHVSSSGQTMSDLGWKKEVWKSPSLRAYLLSVANLQPDITYKKVPKLSDMAAALTASGLGGNFHTKRDMNRIAFYSDGSQVEILSILYYIRCAFAHGRFERYNNGGNPVYAFEAITKKRGTDKYILRARMMLSEETLILWREILSGGSSAFEAQKAQFHESVQAQIKQAISENPIHRKKDLVAYLSYDDSVIYAQLKELTNRGEALYDASKRIWRIR